MKNLNSYEESIQNIKGSKSKALSADNLDMMKFLLCKANKINFLGHHLEKEDSLFYEDVLYNRELACNDESYYSDVNKRTTLSGNIAALKDAKESPKIFCTFHMGSYRYIYYLLIKEKIDFSVIIDDKTLTTQGEILNSIYEEFKDVESPGYLKLLNAESSSIGIQMIREIKSGKCLLLYIDGNSGVGGMQRNDEKLAQIDFLGKKILARKGISYISYATKTPIVPVISVKESESEFRTHFYDEITPSAIIDKEKYCEDTTQFLYDTLAEVLLKYPEQWEGWLYVDRFLDLEALRSEKEQETYSINEGTRLKFNQERFNSFQINDDIYLFDMHRYDYLKISEKFKAYLSSLDSTPVFASDFNNEENGAILKKMFEKKIIVENITEAVN
ncbi:hypothetical protein H7F33_17575 [Pedobacter sp. PAMC26386]|nr:hypothetical protein H7F33_17575 [Pedobacter sp. PAMC26386]